MDMDGHTKNQVWGFFPPQKNQAFFSFHQKGRSNEASLDSSVLKAELSILVFL